MGEAALVKLQYHQKDGIRERLRRRNNLPHRDHNRFRYMNEAVQYTRQGLQQLSY